MKLFLDTANVEEIRKANEMGVICGVTTNPSLIAKEGRDYAETLKEICSIVDGPISGEVKATTEDAEGMIREGREIYAIDPKHMVVKIPMTAEGLKAIKVLSAEGIPTNCTLIFSTNQALLAARAGATGRAVDGAARAVIQQAGYGPYFGHSFGHSVGVEIHEAPNATPANNNPLPLGAAVSAEPGIYLPGRFGVRIEDVLVLQEGGCMDITLAKKDLTIL